MRYFSLPLSLFPGAISAILDWQGQRLIKIVITIIHARERIVL